MDELDLLKKDWKRNENAYSQVSEKEIYAMLHKKSSSIVKWILIISVLEVLFWLLLGLLPFADESLNETYPNFEFYSNCFAYFNYTIVAIFIYLFYRNYVAISTTASTKKLMDDIIRTRKTVNYYVWYNFTMLVLLFVSGLILAFLVSPDAGPFREKVQADSTAMFAMIAIFAFLIVVFALFAWLFYRLLYGIFLKKLLANYKELKKIDL